jgi:CubicO group peptidase (beta-lactamase class C family)
MADDFEWQTAQPETMGMSAPRLEEMRKKLADKDTKELLIIRNDRVVLEWYAADFSPTRTHYTASMAKALVAGLAAAVAINDGQMSLDDAASKFVPQWRSDRQKSKITIRHLGSHTSGIEDVESDDVPHDQLTGWKGDFWKRLPAPNDPFTLARDKAPVIFEPGEKSSYSNPGIAMLTYCTTAAIQPGLHKDIRALLRERVMRPIGIGDREWSIGYGSTFVVGELPLIPSWGGGGFTARATARIGRLMLRQGDWQGKQILSIEAVRAVTMDAGTPGTGAIGWWTNNEGEHKVLPHDAFFGLGAGHQVLLVVPSLNLIAVRNGGSLANEAEYDSALDAVFFGPLVASFEAHVPAK